MLTNWSIGGVSRRIKPIIRLKLRAFSKSPAWNFENRPANGETAVAPRGFIPEPFPYHFQVEILVQDLTNTGLGVGRHGEWVVFVPFVLPGELVKARIIRNYKGYSEAELLAVIRPSDDRVEPKCKYFGRCGGCQYQHMSLEAQRKWKRKQVKDLFERIGGQRGVHVNDVCGTEHAYGYRAKITPHYHAPTTQKPLPAIGFRRALSHQVEDVEECVIAKPEINEKLKEVRQEILASFATTPGRKKRRGATLLLRSTDNGVLTNHGDRAQSTVDGLVFRYKAGEFFQNNEYVLPLLVQHVSDQVTAGGGEITHVVDTYCGVGLFALSLSRHVEVVAGIEINPAGIAAARANFELNKDVFQQQQSKNVSCTFHQGTASDIFDRVQDFPRDRTAVVIDPPRKGCDDEFIRQLLAFAPKRIVYVSCDPATQARDAAKILQSSVQAAEQQQQQQQRRRVRYRLTNVQPFDLFPQTRHIENVATFERIDDGGDDEESENESSGSVP